LKVSQNKRLRTEMAWGRKTEPVDLDSFDPDATYTSRELDAYADAILQKDARESGVESNILFEEQLYRRTRREIKTAEGTVQGIISNRHKDRAPGRHIGDGQAMYNRQHPQGRKVNSIEQRRRNGASYYR
jgi:hypothetical protein